MNQANISGRLGRDVEIKYTSAGKPVAKFSLAVQESYKDKADQWVNKTHWIDCEMWGKQAETMAADSCKGSMLIVEGRLKQDTWEKEGKKFSKVSVTATKVYVAKESRDEIHQASPRQDDDQRPPEERQRPRDAGPAYPPPPKDENLPF